MARSPAKPGQNSTAKRFKVALSFAGERRLFVEKVAEALVAKLGNDAVFYDKFFTAELARTNLDTYLQNIYHKDSELIVVFLCADYARKEWCGLEGRALRDLIKQKEDSLIMPFRFDDTEIAGFFSTDGYVSVRTMPPEEAARLILVRLGCTSTPLNPKNEGEVVSASEDWLLLGQGFYRAKRVLFAGTERVTALVKTSHGEEDAALALLRPDRWQGKSIRFAFRNEAWSVRIKSANCESEGRDNVWTLEADIEQLNYGGTAVSEMSTTGYTADDVAKLRAGRILLNDPSPAATPNLKNLTLEMLIGGMGGQVRADCCPLIELRKSWKGSERAYLECGRLLSVFYLKMTNTVESVLELSLGPLEAKRKLPVRFRGLRKKIFTNRDARAIELEGVCELRS